LPIRPHLETHGRPEQEVLPLLTAGCLRQAAGSLGSGGGRQRLNFRQRDEIGDLGRVFDTMAQTIEDRTDEGPREPC